MSFIYSNCTYNSYLSLHKYQLYSGVYLRILDKGSSYCAVIVAKKYDCVDVCVHAYEKPCVFVYLCTH